MQAIRDRIRKDQEKIIQMELSNLWSAFYNIYQASWSKEDFEKFREYLIETLKTMSLWNTLISQIDLQKCVDLSWSIDKLFEKRVDELLSRIERFDSIEREFSETYSKAQKLEWTVEWLQLQVSNLKFENSALKNPKKKSFWKRIFHIS